MHRISIAIVTVGLASVGFAQQPAFEVASVKRAAPDSAGPGDIPRNMETSPGHFAMRNVPLRFALEWAYDLKDFEISGPDWFKSEERYDIIAKASGPATNEQMRPMLQRLLNERFQIKSHRETKELSVYVLGPGKGAAKVTPATGEGDSKLAGGSSGVTFTRQPISRFTFLLTRRLDRPVLDRTGLPGLYDFTVDISGLPSPGKPEGEGVSIFTAVQRDLGLKLEARKESIPILVIDNANKVPTEN